MAVNRDIDTIRDADERLISAVLADRGNGEQTPEEWDEVDASWSRVEARLAALEQAGRRCQSYATDYSEGRLDATLALPSMLREINEALDAQRETGQ